MKDVRITVRMSPEEHEQLKILVIKWVPFAIHKRGDC